jgi:hypothetical protein
MSAAGPVSDAPSIVAPPMPSQRRKRSACAAPIIQPTAPSEKERPISPDDRPSCRCAYTIRIENETFVKKFDTPVEIACGRRSRWWRT